MIKTLFRLNAFLILLTCLSICATWIDPNTTWFFYFFGIAFPWFAFINVLFIIFWTWQKKRFFIYSTLMMIFAWSNMSQFVGCSLFSEKSDNRIKIMTYNVESFEYLNDRKTESKRIAAVNDFFLNEKPDIVCLQEHCMTIECAVAMTTQYTALKDFYVGHSKDMAMMILSRYPIKNFNFIPAFSKNYANHALFADIVVNEKIIRIYNVHLQSNSVSATTDRLIKNKNLDNKDTWKDGRFVLSRVKNAYFKRVVQAKKVKIHIAQSPYPVLLCGDFNDTPQSFTYSQLSENLQDAWQEQGFGIGSTYAGAIPLLRIDYILVDKKLKIVDCHIVNTSFSDHYPVVATVGF